MAERARLPTYGMAERARLPTTAWLSGPACLLRQVFRQVHTISPSSGIASLHLESLPPAAGEERRWLLLVGTSERYFELMGGPTADDLFTPEATGTGAGSLAELRSAHGATERGLGKHVVANPLLLFRRPNGTPASFVCACSGQLLYGDLLLPPAQLPPHLAMASPVPVLAPPKGSTIYAAGSTPFPRIDVDPDTDQRIATPLSLGLTEFHFIILYPTALLAVSRLNGKVACRAAPPRGWPVGCAFAGLTQDPVKGGLWAWGREGLLRVRVVREERHVWRLHLEGNNFEAALSYCSPTEMHQRDAVLTAQATRTHTPCPSPVASHLAPRIREMPCELPRRPTHTHPAPLPSLPISPHASERRRVDCPGDPHTHTLPLSRRFPSRPTHQRDAV